jgi:thioredoxin 1
MENVTSDKVKELQSQGKTVLVDYWAKWCGPCKSLIPRLEGFESQFPNVIFVKMDVDKNMDYALDMGVRSVPTVIIYDGDKLINRSQGIQPEGFYKDILKNL